MEDQISAVESITDTGGDEVRVVVRMSKKKMAEKFYPYYTITEDLRKALMPVLVEDILKSKDEITKEVLLNVNWAEVVRSEVAQRVIQEIAKKSGY